MELDDGGYELDDGGAVKVVAQTTIDLTIMAAPTDTSAQEAVTNICI